MHTGRAFRTEPPISGWSAGAKAGSSLTADESELITCGDMKIVWDDVFFGIPYHDRQYTRVLLLWADVDEDQMTLQKEEVDAVLWIDLQECMERVAAGTIQNCISLEELNLVQAAAEASA